MADEKIVIEVAVDNEAARKNAVKLNKDLIAQREELKKLRKSTSDTEKQTEEFAKEELRLKNEISETSKQLRIQNKIGQSVAKSKADITAQTAKLIDESRKLDLTTQEGTTRFKELSEQIKSNRDVLKELEGSQGNFTRNVGNYTNSIIEASNSTELFGGAAGKAAEGIGFIRTAAQGATLGFKGLKGAIAATGIGLLLVALGSLVALLTSTRKGTEFLEKALGLLKGIAQAVTNVFVDLGSVIVDFVTGSEDLSASLDKLAESATTGFAETAKAGLEAAKATIEIRKSLRGLNEEAALQQSIAEQNRKLRDDETKSFSERLAANERVIEAEKARTSAQLQQIALRRSEIQREIALNREATDEQLDALSELKIAEREASEDFAGRTTEQLTERNALIREQNELRIQSTVDTIQAELNAEEEGSQKFLALQKRLFAAERQAELQRADAEIKDARALNARKLLIESEYQKNIRELVIQENEKLKAVKRQNIDEETTDFEALVDSKIQLGFKDINAQRRQDAVEQQLAEKDRERKQTNLQAAQAFFQAGEQLAKEGTVAAKLFGIANATIATYQAGAQALATVPFPANIAALAAVIGTGLAQVVQIAGIEFEEGGFVSGQKQRGTEDNLLGTAPNMPLFRFGSEEFIVNKKATQNNMGALQTINSFGKNQKFSVVPQFESGGLVGESISQQVNSEQSLSNLIAMMPPPVVRVSDINKGFANVNISEVGSTFG